MLAKRLLYIIGLINLLASISTKTLSASTSPEAEKYISKILNKQVPYIVKIADTPFTINDKNVYPPGKLTEMFARFLLENNLVKDKVIAEVGAGCFALGILAAKGGAKLVIGTDINGKSLICAHENSLLNHVKNNTILFEGKGLSPLLPKYVGKINLLLSGAPWDTLSSNEYNTLSDERKLISRAFYDIDDQLITDILSKGFELLAPEGKIFITASLRVLNRIEKLCSTYEVRYQIVKKEDLNKDGNIHYILELIQKPK